jgi:hypothetical protein
MQENCSNIACFKQIKTPKLSNMELVALDLTAEYMLYSSEIQLFKVIKDTVFDGKIERSNYNKRRRKLAAYKENVRQCLSQIFTHLSNIFYC